jgi:hypothetical protein
MLHLALGALVLTSFGAIPHTWIVDDDGGPGVDFTDLPAAMAAAADGDVIVVRAGAYSSFAVSGKSLLILGDGVLTTLVSGGVTSLGGPGAGKTLHLEGMLFFAPSGPAGLHLIGAGKVTLTDVEAAATGDGADGIYVVGVEAHFARVVASAGASAVAGGSGLRVEGGGTAAADGSAFVGGDGISVGGATGVAGPGVHACGADATLVNCSAYGGGVPPVTGATVVGGDGVKADAATVRITGGPNDVVAGGAGYGFGVPPPATSPGAGVRTIGAAPSVVVRGPMIVIGGEGVVGAPGPATAGSGVVFDTAGAPRLDAFGDFTSGGTSTVLLEGGAPGSPFLVALAFTPGYFPSAFGGLVGEVLIDPIVAVVFVGVLDAVSAAAFTGAWGVINPGLAGVPIHLQGLVLDGPTFRLSNSLIHVLRV